MTDSPDDSDRVDSSSESKESAPHSLGGPRQTQGYLRNLLDANGLRPRRQLGQNFLIDLNLLEMLVESAHVGPEDVVLEVGSGTGGLTSRLGALAKRVVTVEIDPGFQRLVRREIAGLSNVELICGDVLEGKNKINPEVMAAVRRALDETGRSHFHLVANLPYDVATSVVGNLMLEDAEVRSLTITVQYEVGQRMIAEPGKKDYGPLSVLIQRLGRARWLRTLGPSVFWPRPNVDSCFLRIEVDPGGRADLPQMRIWHRFVRDLFMHRRKTLRSAIASIPGYKQIKPKLDGVLAGLGIPGEVRAETLAPAQLFDLHAALLPLVGLESIAGDDGSPEEAGHSDGN
jgi:16S rRNA (adenine1518-N6/adenine1519-N6)-dimethyltransferase